MNIKLLLFIIVLLLFPGLSLLNIGKLPILRVDFIGQIILFNYLGFKIFFVDKHYFNKNEILLFMSLIFFYSYSSIVNIIDEYDKFNLFNYFKMLIQSSLVFFICFFILNVKINWDKIDMLYIYKFLVNLGVLVSFYGFYQIISWNIMELPFDKIIFNTPNLSGESVVSGFNAFLRPSSIFKEPTHFAFFLQLPIIISLFAYKYKLQKLISLNYIKLFVLIIGFLSTISLFNFISMLVVLFLFFKSFRYYIIIFIVGIFIILYNFDMLGPFQRIIDLINVLVSGNLGLAEGSFVLRLGRILIGIQIWLDHFWFGVGLNNIGNYSDFYNLGDWFKYNVHMVYTNVFYIQALAEVGFLGTFVLTIWFMYIFRQLKYKSTENLKLKYISIVSRAFMIAFLVNQDLPFSSPYRLLYLILIFLAINYKNYYTKVQNE